ncbi:MAG: class I SAM-dependent methyltransferase [Bdellovibrionota bacterium]
MLKSGDFLENYLKMAPVPLAVERSYECEILSKQFFQRPILDIGCGDGIFVRQLFNEKVDVGVEPNEKELLHTKKMKSYTELINCWGDKIPKPDKSFKTIFSNSVLEHIPDLEPVIKEAHRLLSDDGRFYVTVPTEKFDQYSVINLILCSLGLTKLSSQFRTFFNKFWAHYHFHTVDGWKKVFERNGFEVKQHQTYCSKKSCVMNDALAILSVPSLVIKKLTNRWFISERIRVLTATILFKAVKQFADKEHNISSGGIVFFHLEKIRKN